MIPHGNTLALRDNADGYRRGQEVRPFVRIMRLGLNSSRVALGGNAALAIGEEAIHHLVAVLRVVGIGQTQGMTHLVHDRGEQIHAASRRAGWLGIAASS